MSVSLIGSAIGSAIAGGAVGAVVGMNVKESEMLENFFKITIANKIATTAGNEYECIGSNVQVAIDGLDHGTVFVGGDVSLDAPINIKSNVKVDFLDHYVTLNSDITFIYCTSCDDAGVKNCKVFLFPTQTQPVIHLQTTELNGTTWGKNEIMRNRFENMYLVNTGGKYVWTDPHTGKKHSFFQYHDFDAILIDIDKEDRMMTNAFSHFWVEGANTCLHLYKNPAMDTNGFSHHNFFEDIMCWDFVKLVWIEVPSTFNLGYAANTFLRVSGESAEYSTHGFLLTWGSGNFFIHCQTYDWVNWKLYQGWPDPATCPYPYDWVIAPAHDKLRWFYIYSRPYLLYDEGSNTQLCGPPQTWPP